MTTEQCKDVVMYPYVKLLGVLVRAKFKPKLSIQDTSELNLRAGLTEIDPFMELNNARQLTSFELARWDFSMRCGLIKLIRTKKWGLTVGGTSVRFRRRVPFWAKYKVTCKMVCHDGRWFYLHQEMYHNNKICSAALMKVGVVAKRKLVPAPEVLTLLGIAEDTYTMQPWVQAWIDAESQRPWPTKKQK